jgi:hypothetical protein
VGGPWPKAAYLNRPAAIVNIGSIAGEPVDSTKMSGLASDEAGFG